MNTINIKELNNAEMIEEQDYFLIEKKDETMKISGKSFIDMSNNINNINSQLANDIYTKSDIDNKINKNSIDINCKRIWRKREDSQPIYSSPIVTKFTQNNRLVVAHQSWNRKAYVRDFQTGEIMFDRWFSNELYGRPQAADVNGDGLTEFFFVSHAGEIRCYNENNELIWEQYDEYTRQGEGTVTEYVADGIWSNITDNTKNWVDGFGIKNGDVPKENMSLYITGGAGAGQTIPIRHVEWNQLFFYEEPEIPLDNTSTYKIYPCSSSCNMFQHAGTLSEENGKFYLYVTGFDMCCRKIDATTGEILWIYSTKEAIEPYPLITDLDGDGEPECYFVSVDWYVYCCDIKTGELKWKYATDGGNDAFLNTLTYSTGKRLLVVSSRDSRVYLLNSDGTLHNRTTITHADIDSRPIIGDFNGDGKEEFVFGGDSGYVYCCDENGETLWRSLIGIYLNSSAIKADINYDGKDEVLIGDMNGTVSIFDPSNGQVIKEMHFLGSVEGTPAIGDFDNDGLIEMVVTTCDGYIEMYKFLK